MILTLYTQSQDGHIGSFFVPSLFFISIFDVFPDLPILVRFRYANNVSDFDLHGRMPAHVDIPRLREGKVGGFFWSVFVECKNDGPYFTLPSYRVRYAGLYAAAIRQLISTLEIRWNKLTLRTS